MNEADRVLAGRVTGDLLRETVEAVPEDWLETGALRRPAGRTSAGGSAG